MEYKTYKEIKEIVGDGWAFIAEPEWKDESPKMLGGVLIYHNTDKQKVIKESLKEKFNSIKRSTVHYCGERPNLIVLL